MQTNDKIINLGALSRFKEKMIETVQQMIAGSGGSEGEYPTITYQGLSIVCISGEGGSISVVSTNPDIALSYSTDDGQTWYPWSFEERDGFYFYDLITMDEYDFICVKGDNPNGLRNQNGQFAKFVLGSGQYNIQGAINSIVDGDDIYTPTSLKPMPYLFSMSQMTSSDGYISSNSCYIPINITEIQDYACFKMFDGQSAMDMTIDFSNITQIGYSGCEEMYKDCTNISGFVGFNVNVNFGERAIHNMLSFTSVYMNDGNGHIPFNIPTLPVFIGQYEIDTDFGLADYMGRIDGFSAYSLYCSGGGGGYVEVEYTNDGETNACHKEFGDFGAVRINTGSSEIPVTFTATPDQDYEFVKWIGGADIGGTLVDLSTANPYTMNVSGTGGYNVLPRFQQTQE